MNRIQKFIEQGAYGEKAGRTAYAFGPDNLPEPNKSMEWKPVAPFSPADELMADTGLRKYSKLLSERASQS